MSSSNGHKVILTREAIFAAPDITTQEVPVPEWASGGVVYVRGLTGQEHEDLVDSMQEQRGKSRAANTKAFREKLLVASVVDEQGTLLFGPDDILALAKKSAKPLQRLFNVATDLCGFGDDDIEELVKEIEDDPNASSGIA